MCLYSSLFLLRSSCRNRTADIPSLVQELQAEVPARRIKGKIKRLPTYRWPKWLKITIPAVAAAAAVFICGAAALILGSLTGRKISSLNHDLSWTGGLFLIIFAVVSA